MAEHDTDVVVERLFLGARVNKSDKLTYLWIDADKFDATLPAETMLLRADIHQPKEKAYLTQAEVGMVYTVTYTDDSRDTYWSGGAYLPRYKRFIELPEEYRLLHRTAQVIAAQETKRKKVKAADDLANVLGQLRASYKKLPIVHRASFLAVIIEYITRG